VKKTFVLSSLYFDFEILLVVVGEILLIVVVVEKTLVFDFVVVANHVIGVSHVIDFENPHVEVNVVVE
jgi:hypothetical protein